MALPLDKRKIELPGARSAARGPRRSPTAAGSRRCIMHSARPSNSAPSGGGGYDDHHLRSGFDNPLSIGMLAVDSDYANC
jgi:hypothetical protein